MKHYHRLSIALAIVCFRSTADAAFITIDTVFVGNPGNPADATGYGSVGRPYRIGTYEVSNDQYVTFLNAVAATDTFSLYYSAMTTDPRAGILRNGVAGSYTYSTRPNMGNKPVGYVDFWSALRFANWLHNGQPTGAQDDSTTETGAYTLGSERRPPSLIVNRNLGAQWFLPSEDEWYKAAYHKNDGITGNYFLYPTSSDTAPTTATAISTGDVANPGPNVATYLSGAYWNAMVNVTTVGGAGTDSASPYGTFDQGGNRSEWTESFFYASGPHAVHGDRVSRGGEFASAAVYLQSSSRIRMDLIFNRTSLRVATVVPEVETTLLLFVAAIGVWGSLRVRQFILENKQGYRRRFPFRTLFSRRTCTPVRRPCP